MTHQIGHKPHLGGTWAGGDPNSWAPKTWERIIAEKKIKSVIDVGCGDGYSLEWFYRESGRAIGIEGDEGSVARCKEKNWNNSNPYFWICKHDYTEGTVSLSYNPKDKGKDTLVWCCE